MIIIKINYIQQTNEFTSLVSIIRTNLYLARNKKDYYKTIGYLLTGESGIGKTYMIHEVAKLFNVKLFRDNGTPRTNRIDLEGYYTSDPENGNIIFKKGKLILAIEEANTSGFCIYLINEINAIPENEQIGFNELLDFQAELNLACKSDETYRVNEGCFLLIIGTMNLNVSGVNQLQESFDYRFPLQKNLTYPTIEVERKIIKAITGEDVLELVEVADMIRSSRNSFKLSKSLGTRELIRIIILCKANKNIIHDIVELSIINKVCNDVVQVDLVTEYIKSKKLVHALKKIGE